jgi:hypothetical protein
MERSNCRSCKAPILWVRSEHGNLLPVDEAPNPKGTIIIKNGVGFTLSKRNLFELVVSEDEPRYISHFATCPEAPRWRKGNRDVP